jgi:hypothetical protein
LIANAIDVNNQLVRSFFRQDAGETRNHDRKRSAISDQSRHFTLCRDSW